MTTSPATDTSATTIPASVLERWRELQRLRAQRAATPCDCHCRSCATRRG